MTDKQLKNTLKALMKLKCQLMKSPRKSKEFLLKLGFHTKTGKLRQWTSLR